MSSTDGSELPVTTGDAVQAAAALLMHAAEGRPLLPVPPKCMAVLVQMPAPEGYLGNGTRFLKVALPAGTPQPAAHDAPAALRALAGAIRQATAAFRTSPEEPLAAMADTEAMAAAPVPRMLAFLAAERLPLLTCSVNYVPAQPKVCATAGGWGGRRWCCTGRHLLVPCMPLLASPAVPAVLRWCLIASMPAVLRCCPAPADPPTHSPTRCHRWTWAWAPQPAPTAS